MKLLLLHGAGLGKWIWDGVLPHLTVPAEAVDLPGRTNPGQVTLEQCIAFVAEKTSAETVMVGHSISAEIALAAASRLPCAGVILVGGMVPESGKSFLSLLPPPMRLILGMIIKRSPDGVAIPKSQVKKGYCNDLDEATTEMVLRRIVPEVPRIYLDPVEWKLPAALPRAYVKLLDDQSVKPKQQEQMIERIGQPLVATLRSGHLPMLSKPMELAAVLSSRA